MGRLPRDFGVRHVSYAMPSETRVEEGRSGTKEKKKTWPTYKFNKAKPRPPVGFMSFLESIYMVPHSRKDLRKVTKNGHSS